VIPGKIHFAAAVALVWAGVPLAVHAETQSEKTGVGTFAGVQQAIEVAVPFQYLALGGHTLLVPLLAVALDDGSRSPVSATTSSTATQTR
jgi:hypothetical protein